MCILEVSGGFFVVVFPASFLSLGATSCSGGMAGTNKNKKEPQTRLEFINSKGGFYYLEEIGESSPFPGLIRKPLLNVQL